jgi:hypothetical protein
MKKEKLCKMEFQSQTNTPKIKQYGKKFDIEHNRRKEDVEEEKMRQQKKKRRKKL